MSDRKQSYDFFVAPVQDAVVDVKGTSCSVLPSQFSQTEENSGVTMFAASLLVCLLAMFQPVCRAYYAPDEVSVLPGMSFKPNFRQWSGYLQARHGKFLHYW